MSESLRSWIEATTKNMMFRMEVEMVYGPDFFNLSPDMQRVVVLTKRLEHYLDDPYRCYRSEVGKMCE